ncbi:hypothetical protein L249_3069 [Ophiocordyceps polyrhachis-furcata BCC 54312]|uniref:WW domain-containing protein n=1 Tax=Ophiocordyceps polyrhachis-furcata BCC 54312 TaxID=1330021 RepID=A0A367LNS7_9HYPO|nr:hypothetical protein L249_3069 [Ophiocordyceps polyrhachis-furcata BCC 54312]
MLKSTYKPSAAFLAANAPLPPGWSEHKAPTGHSYYYNAKTKESTYRRPGLPVAEASSSTPPPALPPYAHIPNLADPQVANAYRAQFAPSPPSRHDARSGFQGRPRPQPVDKPVRKEAIPGCEPWVLVYTKYSRRFVHHPLKNTSFWRIPEKLMAGVLELDKARVRAKASGDGQGEKMEDKLPEKPKESVETEADGGEAEGQVSEYEEVEVSDDDDDDDDDDDEHRSKRQRTGESASDDQAEAVEFTEADIAAQLQLMGEEYGLEPGIEGDDGAANCDFTEHDAKCLFKDLLDDFNINPYSPWDKLVEEDRLVDDPRYTALTTMRARKECWDEWSRERIASLLEQRAKQEVKDPKIAYLAFLQDKATPKLYWPEFKRKYKKEAPMKDVKLSDKEREKAYRDYIARLKLPHATLKSDLMALLKAQPNHLLHNKSLSDGLPTPILTDIRYISLAPKERDALIEAYVQSLPPRGDDAEAVERDDRKKEREARERRERALEERNRVVEEERKQRAVEVAASKARLRRGEMEMEMAMRVDKRGLQSQLARLQAEDGPSLEEAKREEPLH